MQVNTARPDALEKIQGAFIQHGPLNNRIYLIKTGKADTVLLIEALDKLAAEKNYSKIFAKVPSSKADLFFTASYRQEAMIPHFFNGREDVLFMGKYFSAARKEPQQSNKLDEILRFAFEKKEMGSRLSTMEDVSLRPCNHNDIPVMSRMYGELFKTYPFPINDPEYLRSTMDSNVAYYCAEVENKIVALASAEMDADDGNVEMTDFVCLPAWRGNNFAQLLLHFMEDEMRLRKIRTAYTIARSISAGINISFAKSGYTFGGRLINNTNISGKIESMNVWHKPLSN